MATTRGAAKSGIKGRKGSWRIARLDPNSPDPDVRADARNPELRAALEEARRKAKEPGGTISAEELERKYPVSPEVEAEAQKLLAQWEAEDEAHSDSEDDSNAAEGG